jgi:hypothetical protein
LTSESELSHHHLHHHHVGHHSRQLLTKMSSPQVEEIAGIKEQYHQNHLQVHLSVTHLTKHYRVKGSAHLHLRIHVFLALKEATSSNLQLEMQSMNISSDKGPLFLNQKRT